MKKNHRRLLGWGVGAILIVLVLFHLGHSPQWRNFQWSRLGYLLVHIKLDFLILAILASYSSFFLRALRWRFFVDSIKRCSLWILFAGQIFGFSSIYLIGRAGEVVRPAYIAKAEHLTFSSQLAVWLIERVYDSIALVILFALGLYFQPIQSLTARHAGVLHGIREGAIVVLILSLVGIALLGVYKHYSESFLEWLNQWESTVAMKARSRIVNFLRSFATGLEVIKNPSDFIASLTCTVALWVVNVTAIWLDFRSLGGSLQHLSWWVAALTLVFAALGLAVQLPGVGGGYQVVTLLALRDFFHVSPEGAASAAILTWLTVMVPCIILGLILLLHEGLSIRKLQVIAEEERESVTPSA
jgi:uncharacterized protein (TIRG00374 family)